MTLTLHSLVHQAREVHLDDGAKLPEDLTKETLKLIYHTRFIVDPTEPILQSRLDSAKEEGWIESWTDSFYFLDLVEENIWVRRRASQKSVVWSVKAIEIADEEESRIIYGEITGPCEILPQVLQSVSF